jgi:myo-inositol-1-phosphate synthase
MLRAIFAKPHCTARFAHAVPATGTMVEMGAVFDGVASHMEEWPEDRRFVVADAPQP